jgi:hypothetical protein
MSDEKYEDEERAIMLINKLDHPYYAIIQHLKSTYTKEPIISHNFTGFMERQMAKWLTDNKDILYGIEKQNALDNEFIIKMIFEKEIKMLDTAIIEFANFIKKNGLTPFDKFRESVSDIFNNIKWRRDPSSIDEDYQIGIDDSKISELMTILEKICIAIHMTDGHHLNNIILNLGGDTFIELSCNIRGSKIVYISSPNPIFIKYCKTVVYNLYSSYTTRINSSVICPYTKYNIDTLEAIE